MLEGKGAYIFILSDCENGNPQRILETAQAAGLSHVLIKIADGTYAFNQTKNDAAVTQALQAAGIQVWGWHYVYGSQPKAEADIAIHRVQELGLDGYVIDAEEEYKHKHAQAAQFSQRLREALPETPLALSSFRFPEWHPELPWNEFLSVCDIHMPQVYWEMAHNVIWQLQESKKQCDNLPNAKPYIPTAPLYSKPNWAPTTKDIVDFLNQCKQMGIPAANFFTWDYSRRHLPKLWDSVADFEWKYTPSAAADETPPSAQKLADAWTKALQSGDIDRLLNLYSKRAALIAGARIYRGKAGLQAWFNRLIREIPKNAQIKVLSSSQSQHHMTYLTWKAKLDGKEILAEAHETFVCDEAGRIQLHYTFYEKPDGSSPLLPPAPGHTQPM